MRSPLIFQLKIKEKKKFCSLLVIFFLWYRTVQSIFTINTFVSLLTSLHLFRFFFWPPLSHPFSYIIDINRVRAPTIMIQSTVMVLFLSGNNIKKKPYHHQHSPILSHLSTENAPFFALLISTKASNLIIHFLYAEFTLVFFVI